MVPSAESLGGADRAGMLAVFASIIENADRISKIKDS
jgi:hypothetical protein